MLRLTFDWLYLYDGIKLIPLGLGVFAIPVIIDLAAKGTTIAEVSQAAKVKGAEVMEGVRDVFRHFWLFLRSSVIGAWMGILPGVGGTVATFIAYGQARETSKNRDQFGKGAIEGVIAPEAANNAKEGGALLPTLVLGLPGSGAMAILLGAFILVGLEPGPLFLVEHMDIGFALIWTLVIANAIAAGATLFFCDQLAKIAFIKGHGKKRPCGKTAMVTPSDLDYGLTRVSSAYAEDVELPWAIRPFRRMDQALAWIDE